MTYPENAERPVVKTESKDHQSACSLVLSAVHIPHTITMEGDIYIITVDEVDEAAARHHLTCYLAENADWPPKKELTEHNSSAIQPPTLFIIGALALFFNVTGPWNRHTDWFVYGAGDSTAILNQGEYYRLVTALTLHADITHLLGNCFLGGFLLHFFCKTVGPGIGVFAVLFSAVLGNTINVCLHGEGHHFVGFSTAVFGTIGMLSMVSYHSNRKLSKYRLAAPFMAGVALLAMTGSAGERTDLGAHLFGLLSGFLVGRLLITGLFIKLRGSSSLQLFLFMFTAFIIYFSWDMALQKVY
jgi:membrane associated rhomboid family serine protease